MKKLKKLFYVAILLMLSSVGILFGCESKYANMKLTSNLETDTIVLIYGDDEKKSQTFELRVEGIGGDVSTKVKRPYMSVAGLVEVSLQNSGSVTTVTLTAINYGQTDMIFTTEEGGKTLSLTVKCVLPVESIAKKSTYKPYAIVGETTRISTAEFLYNPPETTQKDVEFEMIGQYAGVEVGSDGTIVASADAQNGSFNVRVKCIENPEVYTEFEVVVLKGTDSITAKYNYQILTDEAELYFSANMLEESYKILEVIAEPIAYNFVLNYRLLDANGNVTSTFDELNQTITSSVFEIYKVDDTHVGLTAKNAGDEYLEITASIAGYQYVSAPKIIKLHSENVAKTISVFDLDENAEISSQTIYDDYKGALGKAIRITLGGEGAIQNKSFVIRQAINSQNADKLHILTGRRDENGNYIEAKLYKNESEDFDLFASGTILYLLADSDLIEGDEVLDSIALDFVAYGTMGLLGPETKTTVNFGLRRGVTSVYLDGYEQTDTVLVAIKETVNDIVLVDSTQITLTTAINEYTNYIYTDSENEGYVLDESQVAYENSIIEDGVRKYIFNIYGVREGMYVLSFYTQNGLKFDVNIRVFTKIDKVTLTTATVEQNSDIGQVEYTTQNNFKTLDGGSIDIRLDGSVNLNFNAYFDKYLRSTTFKKIIYEFSEENIVVIDSVNKMRAVNVGETDITAVVYTYDNETSGEYQVNFHVKVYVAVQNVHLNTKNITLYTLSTLSDYEENGLTNKQKYGEHAFVFKINPDLASITEDDIAVNWTGSDAGNMNITQSYDSSDNRYVLSVSLNSLPAGRTEGRVKLIISLTQYGRMFVAEADILFKNATKVSQIYDVKQNVNGVNTNATQYADAPQNLKSDFNNQFDYYLYFDIRDADESGKIKFNLDAKTYPTNALNPSLNYVYTKIDGYDNMFAISGNQVTIMNAGLGFIDICAVDSYSSQTGKYATKATVLVKVADGNSQSTALEISKASDLTKINQNKQNLEKFYIVTKNINLSAQSSWTPIGYINGEINEFNGYFDGLLEDNFDELICATISGLKFGADYANLGLFAKLSSNAQVKNLNVNVLSINVNTDENMNIGALCAENYGEINNVTGIITTSNIQSSAQINFGAVAGINNGTIQNCYASGEVNVTADKCFVGGIAGENFATIDGETNFFNLAEMNDAYNSQIVINAVYTDGAVGGITGYSNGVIKNASFDGILNAKTNVGGIAGQIVSNGSNSDAEIFNTFSSGIIKGTENIGGLIGQVVGEEENALNILNSSVNMFDLQNTETHIVGTNNVGGLVGQAKYVVIQNAYARSYINPEKLENGDIFANGYVGGIIGYAQNITANKVYSIQTIHAQSGAILGGLVGYANDITITNAFERNTFVGIYGIITGEADGENNIDHFYSSNDELDWTGWSFATSKTEIESGNYNWYLPNGETYPYIIFTNNPAKLLTVEAPTSITIEAKTNSYLFEVGEYGENEQIDNNTIVPNTFVLYKGKTSIIKFANLFEVSVEPKDEVNLLNISDAYSIVSSDTNIIQITGKTQKDYRLKLNSTGKAILTVTSKFNSDVKTEITLYILNAVSGFDLTSEPGNLLVGSNYELVQKLANNYVNNNNFYIKFTNNSNEKLLINNDSLNEKIVKNNEKIFIKAIKSGNFALKYQLFVKIYVGGNTYDIPLGNDNGNGLDTSEKTIDFNFIYGIKDFSGDANFLEMGLNNITNLTYTLTGDDLRKLSNGIYSLPDLEWGITTGESDDMSRYWKTNLVQIKVSFANGGTYVGTKEGLSDFENEITKIIYVLEISANQDAVQEYFKAHSLEQSFEANLTLTAKIIERDEFSGIGIAQAMTSLSIKRQKIDNITLNFYANAEIELNADNEEVYTINEVPSDAIINGQTGIMKIALIPTNAEVTEVKVSYSNTSGYVMSMNQVLKYVDGPKTRYLDRKPFAVATDNGKGIVLYHRESNYVETEGDNGSIITSTNYDGYLYVAFIIPSNAPTGQVFTITVDATYAGGYHYVTSTNLVSRLKSKIEIGYNFDYTYNGTSQVVNLNDSNTIIIPQGIAKEFYVDYTELIEADDIDNLASVVAPNAVGLSLTNGEIKLAETQTGAVKYTRTNSTFRVYYTITATATGDISLSAQMAKTQNSIQTIFKSKTINFLSVPYVITSIDIVDGSNNILTIPQSSLRELDVKISYETASENEYESEIDALRNSIRQACSYWFGKQSGQSTYTPFVVDENKYENYYVKITNNNVSISVKNPETTDIIYLEAKFSYTADGVSVSSSGNSKIEGANIKFNGATQTLRDVVTLNLTNDVSAENAIPVASPEDFLKMSNGTDGQILPYALSKDIELSNYEPRNLENISFDGNGHTIKIISFKTTSDDATTHLSKYGLFNTIDSNSVVKNLTVEYEGLSSANQSSTLDTSGFGLSTMYFGGVAVTNNGIIYNTTVQSNSKLTFVGNLAVQTYIAGVVSENNGFVSYSQSKLSLEANCGFVAGFVAVNSKKISNSKVVFDGEISNTLTSADMSLTAGFVARNRGDIFGCYISGTNYSNSTATVSSRSTVGGFVNQNTGSIDSCFTNVNIESTSRASGFVYQNDGVIKSSYSSSKIEENNSAQTPFTGTDANANYLNSGTIDDCYYIEMGNYYHSSNEPAIPLNTNEGKSKNNFAKFVFAESEINGTWKIDGGYPTLVDADLVIFSQRDYIGVTTEFDADGNPYSKYNWEFNSNSPEYGQVKDGNYNPRTVISIEEWNEFFTKDSTPDYSSDYFVILCDLVAERDSAPNSSEYTFKGTMLGNNMQISNLYLRAKATNTNKCYGLFATIDGAIVKDMTLIARQVVASASRCVGILAGYVNDSNISNITINGTNVEAIQGRNMVGAFAGLINDSIITKINVSGSVNAGYISNNTNLKNYNDSTDIENLTNDGSSDTSYSYAGTFAGAIVGSTKAMLVNVTGENKVIGFYASSCVGLVGTGATLSLASTEIVLDQYVRAYGFAGGLVGENRGTIDRCFVEHERSVQYAIDSNTTNQNNISGRNLTFFAGSPKFVGGLVGFNNGGTITNSYSKLDVRVSQYSTLASGGFVGLAVGGDIENCYATGSVTNRNIIGGFVGAITTANFLQKSYNDSNDNSIRFDDYEVFDKTGATIDASHTVTLKNNLASNKWIVSYANETDADLLSQATTGLLIGVVAQNTTEPIANQEAVDESIVLLTSNNHINTQVLKTNRVEPITTSSISTTNISVLSEISILQNLTGPSLVDAIKRLSIGAYNSKLSSTLEIVPLAEREDKYAQADCVVNNVLVSFENLLNKDELLLDETNGLFGLFKGWSSNYHNLPTKDATSPNYPEIVCNINAQ